jgi:hypothetical protein
MVLSGNNDAYLRQSTRSIATEHFPAARCEPTLLYPIALDFLSQRPLSSRVNEKRQPNPKITGPIGGVPLADVQTKLETLKFRKNLFCYPDAR